MGYTDANFNVNGCYSGMENVTMSSTNDAANEPTSAFAIQLRNSRLMSQRLPSFPFGKRGAPIPFLLAPRLVRFFPEAAPSSGEPKLRVSTSRGVSVDFVAPCGARPCGRTRSIVPHVHWYFLFS